MKTYPQRQLPGHLTRIVSRSSKPQPRRYRGLVPAKNVLPIRFSGNVECLENRFVLSGNPLVSGTINTEGQVEQVELSVSLPDAPEGAKVILGLHASSRDGFDLAAPIARLTPDGARLPTISTLDDLSASDPTGGTYLELVSGTYVVEIFGDGNATSTGDYDFEVFVFGDNGSMDNRVSDLESKTTLAAYYQGIGGGNFVSEQFFRLQGIDLNVDQYNPHADANADGRIGIHDLDNVQANAALGTVDLELSIDDDPPIVTIGLTNDTGSDGDLLTTDPAITINVSDESDIASLLISVNSGAQVDHVADLDQATGEFTWDQAALESVLGSSLSEGSVSISVVATDQIGLTAEEFTFAFTYFMNDAPQLDMPLDDINHDEDSSFSLSTANRFSDEDSVFGDSLSFSAVQFNEVESPLPGWLSIDSTTGELSGTPLNDDVHTYGIKVIAADTESVTAAGSFSLTINPIANDPPEIVAGGITDQTATETMPFSIDLNGFFSDPDVGDSIETIKVVNGGELPNWLSLQSGVLSGTPGATDLGVVTLTATAVDTTGLSVSDNFDLNVLYFNDPPQLKTPILDQVATEDLAFSLNVSGNFSDPDVGLGHSLTLSTSLPPDWLNFDAATGEFSGTPTNDDVTESPLSITATATDESGLFVSDDFELIVENVNDAPEISINDRTAPVGIPIDFNLRDLVGQAGSSEFIRDVDMGDEGSLSIDITSVLPDWLSFDPATDTLSGIPEATDVETSVVTVSVSDSLATASDTFSLEVLITTSRPTISEIPGQVVAVDESFSLDLEQFVQDADTPLDHVGITAIQADGIDSLGGPINGQNLPEWLTLENDFSSGPNGIVRTFSVLTGTPGVADIGSFDVFVQAFDDTVIIPLTSTMFTIDVVDLNQAPFLVESIGDQTTNDSQPFSFDVSGFFDDPDGDALNFAATQNDGSSLPDWLNFDQTSGTFSGTPDDSDIASLTINVTGTDLRQQSATGSFSLDVLNTEESPVLVQSIPDTGGAVSVPFSLDVSGHFDDPDAGDTLSFTAETNVNGLPTWLAFNATTGFFSGTPTNSDTGSSDITVTAIDSTDQSTSDTFTLVIAANESPLAVDDGPFASNDNVNLSVTASDFLSNDSDPENSTINITDVDSTSVLGAEISFDGTTITYNPIPADIHTGEQLQDTFTYTISDGTSTDTADVTVNLTGVNLIEFRVKFFEFVGPNDDGFFDFNGDGNHDLPTPEITKVETGQKFVAAILIEDVQPPADVDGVFSAFVDVTYSSGLVMLDGEVVHGLNYTGATNSDLSVDGLINEVGGVGPTSPLEDGEFELFRVHVDAGSTAGIVTFATDTKEAVNREVLLYRSFVPDIPLDQIGFGSNSIEIVSGSAAASSAGIVANPNDVNGDGQVTPFDALYVINMMEDSLTASAGSVISHELCDVNNDGNVTPYDALLVINEIENGDVAPVAAMSSSAVRAPRSAMSASANVATLQDEVVINPIVNNQINEIGIIRLNNEVISNGDAHRDVAVQDIAVISHQLDSMSDDDLSLADVECTQQDVDDVFAGLSESL